MATLASAGASKFDMSEAAWRFLIDCEHLKSIGSFVGYQALVSMASVQHQAKLNWYHPDEHAIPGNGCIGGLQRLYPGIRITSKTGLAATKAWKMHIACKAKILFGRSGKKWDLQSAEHTPCEFKKFRDGVIFFAYKFSVPLKGLTSKEKGRAPRRKRRSVLSKFKKIA